MSTAELKQELKLALEMVEALREGRPLSEDEADDLKQMEERLEGLRCDDAVNAEDHAEFCEHRLHIKRAQVDDNDDVDGSSLAVLVTCSQCHETAHAVLCPADFTWEKLACDKSDLINEG